MNKNSIKTEELIKGIAEIGLNEHESLENMFWNRIEEIGNLNKMKFYRFRSISGNSLIYTLSEILENYVYMASASKMNDLYDSFGYFSTGCLGDVGIRYDVRRTNKKIQLYEDGYEKKYKEKVKIKDSWNIAEEISRIEKQDPNSAKELNAKLLNEIYEEEKYIFQNSIRLSCFTTSNKNIPMWYNYADKHTGICIEYDFSGIKDLLKENDGNCIFAPVVYVKKFNEFILDSSRGNIAYAVNGLLKHKDWDYENEWRLLSWQGGFEGRFINIPIKAIYLGVNAEEKTIDVIKEIIKLTGRKIKVFKMQVANNGLRAIPY